MGIVEILLIVVVVVLLFGARKLPEIGKGLGRQRNTVKALGGQG